MAIDYTVPDMFGRPWAQIWERSFEEGMERPADESIFDFWCGPKNEPARSPIPIGVGEFRTRRRDFRVRSEIFWNRFV